jgi:AcrR family transcriptional regulator
MSASTRRRAGGAQPILDATLEVIARDGVSAATVRAVAAQAQVSPGTVSHHFASSDELLLEALRHGSGQIIAELERLALDLQAGDWDVEGWAGAFAAALDHSIRTHPEHHIACFELRLLAIRRPELRPVADEVLWAYLRLAHLVLQAVDAPEPAARAAQLVAMTTGLVLAELGAPDAGREERLRMLLLTDVT